MSTAVAIHTPEAPASVAVAAYRPAMLRPIAPAGEVLAVQNETRALIAATLQKGRDYGEIPGVTKPSLLKPGAERVGIAFGCFPRYRIVEQEVDHDRVVPWRKQKRVYNNKFKGDNSFTTQEAKGESLGLYRYVVECEIVHRDSGQVVGACIGVCSTLESKYLDRPREVENTVLKMAEKRAHVGAVLNAFGLSDQFTQDVEDMTLAPVASEAGAERSETRSAPVAPVGSPAGAEQTAAAGASPAPVPQRGPSASGTDDIGASAKPTDEPPCPKCDGKMWDNRIGKRNPKAPDFKCRDKACDGVVWPPKGEAAAPVKPGRESASGPFHDDAPRHDDADLLPF